ncbi:hypothetical protein HRM2_48530 [Desulforapulum autotrophicum HRM2]|uniref:Uncharacterized protein n=1 Tax=Desulforapulum autotrophicum (strain ATCC 43914 / DSM 3382 / VKM B-1955 / HRM2) TaxID=177437 RepID=C0QIF7_DESAH|nr:hypothetical protein HRM2_48530 [Desulforapulum autotrophicum HRM2]
MRDAGDIGKTKNIRAVSGELSKCKVPYIGNEKSRCKKDPKLDPDQRLPMDFVLNYMAIVERMGLGIDNRWDVGIDGLTPGV